MTDVRSTRTTPLGRRSGAFVHRCSDDLALHEGTIVGGAIEAILYPEDVAIQTDEDIERWRREAREAEERRRPCGFAPWPDEQAAELRRVA
jgi:hypothetical protein